MSDNMVERVARRIRAALHDKLFAMNGYSKLPAALERVDDVCEVAARAAIEAMREPTPQMREAGDTWAEGETSVEASENIATAWRAMIDAAIASKG